MQLGRRTEVEALCRGFLENAAARQAVVARVDPEVASADYLVGFSAGWEAGQVAALALSVGVMSGESPTALGEDGRQSRPQRGAVVQGAHPSRACSLRAASSCTAGGASWALPL